MSKPIDRLESEALELPTRQRAHLAHRLIQSLGPGGEADPDDRGLAEEIARRAERAEILEEVAIAEAEIARGEAVDHETAKARLRRAIGR